MSKNYILETLENINVEYDLHPNGRSITVLLDQHEPIRGKRCVAYYGMQGKGARAWKVEINGTHLKWVNTREEVETLIKIIEG
jgi:hypothetical protein